MIEQLIWLILTFFGVFFISQVTHELWHYFIAKRYGGKPKITITTWHHIPTMYCTNGGGDVFYFAGMFNGMLYFLLSGIFFSGYFFPHIQTYPFSPWWLAMGISCYINTMIQFVYGAYEIIFIHRLTYDDYMKWHYPVLLVAGITGSLMMLPQICRFIGC